MIDEFNPAQIIDKKKRGKVLSSSEIKQFIQGFMENTVADYQMTAMLMAMFLKGLNTRETQDLTDAMLYSGKSLVFKDPTIIDKHSTGGIGDKTSFILGPIAAACGVKVPMVAGRGLSFTAGTVDKFEAIPGIQTNLNLDQFSKQLLEKGIVMMGQTHDIAPADKRIYALRDVTATVDCIPLITASIMSKKLAEGARGMVFDIKCGSGAFMKTLSEAKKLAKSLGQTAERFQRSTCIYITDMNRPLGKTVGHSLELIECFETLKNRGPKDLTDLSVELAGAMIFLAGLSSSIEKGKAQALSVLKNGMALKKLADLIKWQGGNDKVIDDYLLLPSCKEKTPLKAEKEGFIHEIDTKEIGLALVELGGGRKQASDKIDFAVGMTFLKTLGDKVQKGETILEFHHHKKQKELVQQLSQKLNTFIKIQNKKPKILPLIYDKQEKLWKNNARRGNNVSKINRGHGLSKATNQPNT